jgi:hypothetical protein
MMMFIPLDYVTPRAACGATPQGAMLAERQSRIGGILS